MVMSYRPTKHFKGQEALPRFHAGERIQHFVVERYMGQSTVHPGTAKVLSKDHHWYRCTCDCGAIEIQSQQQLADKRRTHACSACLKKGIDT